MLEPYATNKRDIPLFVRRRSIDSLPIFPLFIEVLQLMMLAGISGTRSLSWFHIFRNYNPTGKAR
jgi:hypothetical protein